MHKTERKNRALCCRAAAKLRIDLRNEEKLRCKRENKIDFVLQKCYTLL